MRGDLDRREVIEPPLDGCVVSIADVRERGVPKELPREPGVVRSYCVANRAIGVTTARVPARRTPVKVRLEVRLGSAQLRPQCPGEQGVQSVAVLAVHGEQQHVGVLEPGQQAGRAGALEDRVASGARQPLEDGRTRQEREARSRNAAEDLVPQVIRNDTLIAVVQRPSPER